MATISNISLPIIVGKFNTLGLDFLKNTHLYLNYIENDAGLLVLDENNNLEDYNWNSYLFMNSSYFEEYTKANNKYLYYLHQVNEIKNFKDKMIDLYIYKLDKINHQISELENIQKSDSDLHKELFDYAKNITCNISKTYNEDEFDYDYIFMDDYDYDEDEDEDEDYND